MKTALISMITLMSAVSAIASTETLSLTCDAKELKVGGRHDQAQILITKNETPLAGRATSLGLVFGNENVSSDSVACGVEIAPETTCEEYTNRAGLPFELKHNCGEGAIDGTGTFRYPIETKLVMDMNGTHGRFYCKNKEAGVFRAIEFSNCK